jgi:hypothetical protein
LGNYPSQQLVYIYIGINIKIETVVVDLIVIQKKKIELPKENRDRRLRGLPL